MDLSEAEVDVLILGRKAIVLLRLSRDPPVALGGWDEDDQSLTIITGLLRYYHIY